MDNLVQLFFDGDKWLVTWDLIKAIRAYVAQVRAEGDARCAALKATHLEEISCLQAGISTLQEELAASDHDELANCLEESRSLATDLMISVDKRKELEVQMETLSAEMQMRVSVINELQEKLSNAQVRLTTEMLAHQQSAGREQALATSVNELHKSLATVDAELAELRTELAEQVTNVKIAEGLIESITHRATEAIAALKGEPEPWPGV